MAPFMLENLNCTGSEARLVDCPVATDVPIINYFDYTYEVTYIGRPSTFCDFFEGKVYAFVACGSATGPGTAPPGCYSVAARAPHAWELRPQECLHLHK